MRASSCQGRLLRDRGPDVTSPAKTTLAKVAGRAGIGSGDRALGVSLGSAT